MRRTTSEKVELIRLVEGSDLSVWQTLRELRLNRSTCYAWYRRYTQRGRAGLEEEAQQRLLDAFYDACEKANRIKFRD
jgi:transposase-like protein